MQPLLRAGAPHPCRVLCLVAAAATAVVATPQTLDCPLRQIAVDYAQQLQPWRPLVAFQQVADGALRSGRGGICRSALLTVTSLAALNGAEEAQNCSVAPTAQTALAPGPATTPDGMLIYPLPTSGLIVYADPNPSRGSDARGDGSVGAPFLSLERAVEHVRAKRSGLPASTPASIVLRAGASQVGTLLHPRCGAPPRASCRHLPAARRSADPRPCGLAPQLPRLPGRGAVHRRRHCAGGPDLDPRDAPQPLGEQRAGAGACVSRLRPPTPAAQVWELRPGGLSAGFDALPAGSYTLAQAQALCTAAPTCASFQFDSTLGPNPSVSEQQRQGAPRMPVLPPPLCAQGPVAVSFKYETFWAPAGEEQAAPGDASQAPAYVCVWGTRVHSPPKLPSPLPSSPPPHHLFPSHRQPTSRRTSSTAATCPAPPLSLIHI